MEIDKIEYKKSNYEITVDLIKAIVWPFLIILFLLVFWSPVHLVIEQVPNIIDRSQVITVAGVSIRSKEKLVNEASPRTKAVLSNISSDGLLTLLEIHDEVYWSKGDERVGRRKNSELVQFGLVDEIPDDEIRAKGYSYGVSVTSFGSETQEFLVALMQELIRDIENS